jgi:hypothetical protein
MRRSVLDVFTGFLNVFAETFGRAARCSGAGDKKCAGTGGKGCNAKGR